uniref:Uncharacterized protein n=1 Tax=Sphaerodactylus townsendi TaxID=933632 RepID=A0ACB8F567_9SAUR
MTFGICHKKAKARWLQVPGIGLQFCNAKEINLANENMTSVQVWPEDSVTVEYMLMSLPFYSLIFVRKEPGKIILPKLILPILGKSYPSITWSIFKKIPGYFCLLLLH